MCPSYKRVNLQGGFSAGDGERKKGNAGGAGGCSTWDWKLHLLQHLGTRGGEELGRGHRLLPAALWEGPGGVPGDSCWGSRFLTEEAVLPGPVPVGARSCSQLPVVWERWPLPPQLRRLSLPSTIYSQARSAAPPAPLTAAAAATTVGRQEGGRAPSRGDAPQAGLEQQGEPPPGLLQSPTSWICPPGEAKASPFLTPNPLGVLGSTHTQTAPPPQAPLPAPLGLSAGAGCQPGQRGSAREESTRFPARGNWSTLSFRCL